MNEYIKLAWRNIWRNKRRTIITAASIFFAVFLAIIMRGFQLGTYTHMINQSVESYSGYLQIQHPRYFDEENIDYSLVYNESLLNDIRKTPGVKAVTPRINNFSFASFNEQSKGVVIMAIDPIAERKASNPEHQLIHFRISKEDIAKIEKEISLSKNTSKLLHEYEGLSFKNEKSLIEAFELDKKRDAKFIALLKKYCNYPAFSLKPNDDGVYVSDRLSKYLKIDVGDTLVLMGQGFQGASAAGLFPVRGIIKMLSPELDNKLVYMTLYQAQTYFSMPDRVNYFAVNLYNPDDFTNMQKLLQAKLSSDEMTVKNWQELNPTLQQQIEGDNKSGQMFVFILYFIIFFGIFGTVLMMLAERKREFGVMVAIGMKKKVLSLIVVLEMLMIGFIGTIAGMIAAAPIILLGYYFPIRYYGELAKMMEDMGFDALMPMEWFGSYFYMQAVVVFFMVILACYFPLRSIRKMKIINNLRA